MGQTDRIRADYKQKWADRPNTSANTGTGHPRSARPHKNIDRTRVSAGPGVPLPTGTSTYIFDCRGITNHVGRPHQGPFSVVAVRPQVQFAKNQNYTVQKFCPEEVRGPRLRKKSVKNGSSQLYCTISVVRPSPDTFFANVLDFTFFICWPTWGSGQLQI